MDAYADSFYKFMTEEARALALRVPLWRLAPTRAMYANALCHADRMRREDVEQVAAQLVEDGHASWILYCAEESSGESKFEVGMSKVAEVTPFRRPKGAS